MSDTKNNIFVQLYKPIDPATLPDDVSNQQTTGKPALSPESDPFSSTNASEYSPIMEYVEPQIDPALEQHVQNANPPFVPQPDIPLNPTQTPPVPGIQPMSISHLPLTEAEIETDLKTNVYTAIRWLAEWCLRQLQMHSEKKDL